MTGDASSPHPSLCLCCLRFPADPRPPGPWSLPRAPGDPAGLPVSSLRAPIQPTPAQCLSWGEGTCPQAPAGRVGASGALYSTTRGRTLAFTWCLCGDAYARPLPWALTWGVEGPLCFPGGTTRTEGRPRELLGVQSEPLTQERPPRTSPQRAVSAHTVARRPPLSPSPGVDRLTSARARGLRGWGDGVTSLLGGRAQLRRPCVSARVARLSRLQAATEEREFLSRDVALSADTVPAPPGTMREGEPEPPAAQPLLRAVIKVSVSIPAESGHVALPELARFPRILITCWACPFPAWPPQLRVVCPPTGSFPWSLGTPSPASRPLPSPLHSSLGPSPAPPSSPGRGVSATPPAQAHPL